VSGRNQGVESNWLERPLEIGKGQAMVGKHRGVLPVARRAIMVRAKWSLVQYQVVFVCLSLKKYHELINFKKQLAGSLTKGPSSITP